MAQQTHEGAEISQDAVTTLLSSEELADCKMSRVGPRKELQGRCGYRQHQAVHSC